MSKQVSYLDLAGRFRRRPEPERGEPAWRGRRAAPRLGGSAGSWRQSHGKQGGEVNESTRVFEESVENVGAGVMGRNMFGPIGGGAWGDEQWMGWWGDEPPYHYPVFILTHHQRDPVVMEGRTTFHFVTDGIESALDQARMPPAAKTSCFGAAARSRSSTWQRDCWTNLSSTSFRWCSATVLASSTTSGTRRCGSSSPGRRGARRHPPQVQEREMKRVAERP